MTIVEKNNLKNIIGFYRATEQHWVGDGFPVKTLFSSQQLGQHISPFLMLDYGGPLEFPPSNKPRGVDQHPHKGFETVTIVYQGELEHRDSTGKSGSIGPGDVQWMTAASGIVHEEKHSAAFTKNGGMMEMAQLWINLPARFKQEPPGYQTILNNQIPSIALPDNSGTVRIIAGDYLGTKGPAETFTPMNVWDIRLSAEHSCSLRLSAGTNTLLVILDGEVTVNEKHTIQGTGMAMFEKPGEVIALNSTSDAKLLLLNGEPINEPIVSYGPFVMNTKDEIVQAIEEYQSGKMGRL